ncbi:MAG: CHAT domain-containing protein, partial [Ignavibacteriaceae bacterium]|nr:CHAT domain-containing protein [Ignavibacteriaceae bacterium]
TPDSVEGKIAASLNLGRVYRSMGLSGERASFDPFQKAEEYFSLSEKFANENFQSTGNEYYFGEVYLNTGLHFQSTSNFQKAEVYYNKAKDYFQKISNIPYYAFTLANIAVLKIKEGDQLARAIASGTSISNQEPKEFYDLAKTFLKEAINLFEDQRGSITNEIGRSTFFENKIVYYEYLIEILFNEGNYKEAFEFTERAKSRSFLDQILTKSINSEKVYSPEVQEYIKRERDLRNKINELREYPDSINVLAALNLEYKEVTDKIKELEPGYSTLISVDPLSVEEIQSLLPEKTGMIEFFLGRSFSAAFFVSKDSFIAKRISYGSTELSKMITDIQVLFYDYLNLKNRFWSDKVSDYEFEDLPVDTAAILAKWNLVQTPDKWQWNLVSIYGILFGQELTPAVQKVDNLIIIPHGSLHNFPFNALITSPAKVDLRKEKHIASPKFLIQEKSISVLPSSSLLKFSKEKREPGNLNALIIGDPIYPRASYKPLPNALAEAIYIYNVFGDNRALLLTRESATETAFKEKSKEFDIIHFGTHGVFYRSALDSRLLMTKTGADDGYLLTREIFELDINAALVMLSACESGQVGGFLEDRVSVGDEFTGLTRAFLFAGAESVVATLWRVDDSAAGRLTEIFYSNFVLENQSKLEALRSSQLKILSGELDPEWIHPFYWAPFVYTGY